MQVPRTDRQQARHAAVITATMELAAEGGYDAVQMRDVAARAGVALGTLYRYFSSKNHLLVAALARTAGDLETRLRQRPPRGASPVDRVVDTLQRLSRAFERNPAASAMVTALTSLSADDPKALELAGEIYESIGEMITAALGDADVPDRQAVIRVLSEVWLAALIAWVRGWAPAGQAGADLEAAARLTIRT